MTNPPSRKGAKASSAQIAAMNAGRAKRHEQLKERKTRPRPAKSRHQMLLDGELTVADMDEDELERFMGKDINGEFVGSTKMKSLPPKMIMQIEQLFLGRMNNIIKSFVPKAAEILQEIAEHSEHEPSRVKAADLLMQRGAGKVPDVIRILEDPWAEALEEFLETADDEAASKARDRLSKMDQGAEIE